MCPGFWGVHACCSSSKRSLKNKLFFVSDIIGICKSYEDSTKITVKSNNREVAKRNIYLMDMSGKVVTATLWGEDVSPFTERRSVGRGLVFLNRGALAPKVQG